MGQNRSILGFLGWIGLGDFGLFWWFFDLDFNLKNFPLLSHDGGLATLLRGWGN